LPRLGSIEGVDEVLFQIIWEFIDNTEEGQKRSLGVFARWQPGPAQFQGFYGYADGTGGMAIVEANSATELAKTLAPWTPWLSFETKVLLPIQESAEIGNEAIAFREANG
jgi:hypothetical protein